MTVDLKIVNTLSFLKFHSFDLDCDVTRHYAILDRERVVRKRSFKKSGLERKTSVLVVIVISLLSNFTVFDRFEGKLIDHHSSIF